MRGLIGFTKRNLLIYFKDFQSVVFSLLTSIIVFVLYLVFLKGTYLDSFENMMEGLENIISSKDIETFVNSQLLAGIIGSAVITIPFNCLSTIVRDRENKVDYDISATPMKRGFIVFSYFLSSVISAFLMTSVILTGGLLIMAALGEFCLSLTSLFVLYAIILLGSLSSTALFMIVIIFFNSSAASGAFFGMLSAAAGFVIGAYIPISQFSENMRTVCHIFPATHVAILFRKSILTDVLDKINTDINGLDNGMFKEGITHVFSFQANMFGEDLSSGTSIIYICAFAVISIAIMTVLYSKTYKRR